MNESRVTAIIVDDEDLARSAVRSECERHTGIEIVSECANGFEAVKAISELSPDIVFLDIQMPKLSGFEVLELVEGDFAVVFITAHDDFALQAFEANAIDYLLKPFTEERFDTALEKALRIFRGGEGPNARRQVARITEKKELTDRILVKDGSKVHVLSLDSISRIEAEDDYVAIVGDGRRYLKQQTMTSLEMQLPPQRFVRIHRSSIINLDFLSKIELYAKDSRVAILKDGTKVNVSRSGYEKLKGYLEN